MSNRNTPENKKLRREERTARKAAFTTSRKPLGAGRAWLRSKEGTGWAFKEEAMRIAEENR